MAIPDRTRTIPRPCRSISKITEPTVGGGPDLSLWYSFRKQSSDNLPTTNGIRTRLRIKVINEKNASHPKSGSKNPERAGKSAGKLMLMLCTDKTVHEMYFSLQG
jgi:hypothetical protein